MLKLRKTIVAASLTALALGVSPFMASPASAQTVSGWVGPAGTTGYLHVSTVVNSPDLYAESKIYHTFGSSSAPGKLGVRPRLFKSGALCEAVDYSYNFYVETEWKERTSATCGSGSYNSHGFVAVWNSTNSVYDQFVTFPTNPVNWTAPAARTARAQSSVTDADRAAGTNSSGETFGSAATENSEGLDLILAIGDNGEIGYVRTVELDQPVAANPDSATKSKPSPRPIPLLSSDGNTTVGTFTVN